MAGYEEYPAAISLEIHATRQEYCSRPASSHHSHWPSLSTVVCLSDVFSVRLEGALITRDISPVPRSAASEPALPVHVKLNRSVGVSIGRSESGELHSSRLVERKKKKVGRMVL